MEANIRKIYEDAAQTKQIMPQTNEKAVIDDNGTPLNSKLGQIVDLVNQKQMEVGAVPSDLTPTKDSTNWVTSGGVFDATNYYYDNDKGDFTLSFSNNYLTYNSNSLGLEAGKTYLISASISSAVSNANIAFYLRQTANQNTPNIPIKEGTHQLRINKGNLSDSVLFTAESDVYQYLAAWSNNSGANTSITKDVTITVVEVYRQSVKERIVEQGNAISDINNKMAFPTPFDTTAALVDFHISNTTFKWVSSTTYKGKIIDIGGHRGDGIVIAKNPNGACRYAFLTANTTVNNASPNYCDGRSLVNVSSGEREDTIPLDANYIYLYAYSNGTDVTPTVTIKRKVTNMLSDNEFVKSSNGDIDMSSLNQKNCSLATSNVGWYMGSSNLQRHVAVAVNEGDAYRITFADIAGNATTVAYYGFLTSSYNPETTYSKGDTIPYVSGSDRNSARKGNPVVITIPSNCAWLVFSTVDGGGNACTWTLEKGTIVFEEKDLAENIPVKIKIAHWNIAHFSAKEDPQQPGSYTTSYDTLYTHDDYAVKRPIWAEKINNISADIFMCCEYNTNIVNAEGSEDAIKTRYALFSPYEYAYEGSKPSATSYMQTAIFTNKQLRNVRQVVYPHTLQNGRYYQAGDMTIGNKIVAIVETHLDLGASGNGHDYRHEQIQQLISDFANYDYVIIGGDFNTNNCTSLPPQEDEFEPFAEAGYDMINWGYLGYLDTMVTTGFSALDNIVAKGFKVNGIHVVNDNDLSDHYCIYADFTMIK